MKFKVWFFKMGIAGVVAGVLTGLTACGANMSQGKTAREMGEGPDQGQQSPKPTPSPGKTVEKIKALQFQKPTQEEAEFLNVMELKLTEGERAFFSFFIAPENNGTFFFSLAQTRLHLQGCKAAPDRSYKMRVLWQEVQGTKRVVLKEFHPSIDSFDFTAGGKYILSYALMDLKEFSDCESATLKFASFLQNYKEK